MWNLHWIVVSIVYHDPTHTLPHPTLIGTRPHWWGEVKDYWGVVLTVWTVNEGEKFWFVLDAYYNTLETSSFSETIKIAAYSNQPNLKLGSIRKKKICIYSLQNVTIDHRFT